MVDRKISRKLKGKVLDSCVVPASTFGLETLVLCELHQHKLQVCENNWIRKLAGVRRVERRRMKYLREEVGTKACRRKEMAHVQDALKTNGYKQWMFKVPRPKQQQSTTSTGTMPKTTVGLPYMHGTSEALARVFKAHGVGTYHRPINTIRSILVHPKDKTPDAQKCGLVYQVECPECPLTYIGETDSMLATRMKDQLNLRNPLTAVGEHCTHEHHTITKDSVRVLVREDSWLKRKVREAIEIKIVQPAMNRDQGYELSPPSAMNFCGHVIVVKTVT